VCVRRKTVVALPTGGNYPLTYEYNLGGQLKKITDPFNAQVAYGRDAVGHVSAAQETLGSPRRVNSRID
jgi:hypothetical protein